MRVGAVVDARRVATGAIQQRHEECGERGGREDGDRELHARRSPELQREAEEQRPHQIELLLDRQRPQVLEHRLAAEAREIRLLVEDQVPVGDVAERRDHGPAEFRCLVREEHDDVRARHRDHREQRREQPPRAVEVEAAESEPATVPPPCVEQHRRDQVTAEHEEHVDAEEPAAEPSELGVVQEHGGDREGAHTVQRRDVAEPRPRAGAVRERVVLRRALRRGDPGRRSGLVGLASRRRGGRSTA